MRPSRPAKVSFGSKGRRFGRGHWTGRSTAASIWEMRRSKSDTCPSRKFHPGPGFVAGAESRLLRNGGKAEANPLPGRVAIIWERLPIWVAKWNDDRANDRRKAPIPFHDPGQSLGDGIDLIVMTALREPQQLANRIDKKLTFRARIETMD